MNTRFVAHLAEPPRVSALFVMVMFKGGGQAALHSVITGGGADRFLFAVPHASGEHLVDVRRLVPELGDELPPARAADRPHLLYQSMRLRFETRDEFMSAVLEHALKGLAAV